MDAHEDFDEFVAARWVRLFRLAHLLTGDEASAEDVLQTAMARTFARWPRVTRMESPETYVRRLMVDAVASDHRRPARRRTWLRAERAERPVPPEDGRVVDHLLLWPLVCALPEQQRAVVVLRYHENLSEGEAADVLGCAVGTVRSHTRDAMHALWRGLDAAPTREYGRGMSLDKELRDVLAAQADRCEGPVPDVAAIRAGGVTVRRRRRRRAVTSSALAALLLVLLGVRVVPGLRDQDGADLAAGAPAAVATSTAVPWCVPDPDPTRGQLVVGAGAPVRTECRSDRAPVRLWHHAGTTVLTKHGGVYRVASGRLTPLGGRDGDVRMSHDGRLAAWLARSTVGSSCGLLRLEVYDVARATEVATTEVEAVPCGQLAGIDDRGRVYVTVSDDRQGVLDVRMYDTASHEWTPVTGLPVPSGQGVVTYVTADGFAVQIAEHTTAGPGWESRPLASVEGSVDTTGRFVPRREVPIGRGRWSPDRSMVADQQPEGVVVRSADLTRVLSLDLPADLFAARPLLLPEVDLLWESPTSLLAVSGLEPGSSVYRCDVRSGSCERVDRLGQPALGNSAQPGG